MLDIEQIRSAAKATRFSSHLELYEELDSTNTFLKSRARDGAEEGCAVLAQRQSAGRGRIGRSFSSPPDCGVYLSVLLRPRIPLEETTLFTAAAAVCTARAVERVCGLETAIKWVNDVFIAGKKICGILTESACGKEGTPEFVVIGIGVNVNTPASAFEPPVRAVATSLMEQAGRPVSREAVAAALLCEIESFYADFPQNLQSYRDAYTERLMYIGEQVAVAGDDSRQPLTVLGVDERFGLIVRKPDASVEILRSGEVSVRPARQGEGAAL